MPFANYKNFTECLKDQKKAGYSDKAAGGICGLIESRHNKKKKMGKADTYFNFEKYLPISKVNDEERMVYGYASTPDLDSQGEIVELAAIKTALPNYMKFPTIREMHTTNAVGRTKSAMVDEKGLFIGAKIVDDNAWKKVKEGVFNGFSIGGRVKQMIDKTITSLDLTEISLVDVPANKQAIITLFKSEVGKSTTPYEDYLVKFAFNWEEVNQLKNIKKQEEVIEQIEETNETPETLEVIEEVATEQVSEELVVEETPVVEVEPSNEEIVAEAREIIEEELGEEAKEVTETTTETPEVKEVEEAKEEVEAIESEKAEKIEDTLNRIEKMEKKYDQKIEKFDSIEKMDKALSKLASVVEKLHERLERVENTPAESKTKASFLVEKSLGGVQIEKQESIELTKAKEEFAQLLKVRETNPERYAVEKMSDRAFELRDRISKLSN